MAASVEGFVDLIREAHEGRLKLPAFQRDWKWKPSQVTLLFDSLRQRYPIGSFLFLNESDSVNLSPRSFRGASNDAATRSPSRLVLDGQQRITAGIELFFGTGARHYFIDVERLAEAFSIAGGDIDSGSEIRKFLTNLDVDDGYCRAIRAVSDPESLLLKRSWLWTAHLLEEDALSRSIRKLSGARSEFDGILDLVIRNHFRPTGDIQIPVTAIDERTTVEAICRIFATLNSSGKILTPFEIVAAVLFPHNIALQEDVEVARELYPYFDKLDQFGDIFLQTIALFDGKDTKKASLPTTIKAENYNLYKEEALKYLNEAGKLLTQIAGLGLDRSDELLVYPVIFSPLAFVLRWMESKNFSTSKRAEAHRKIKRWYYGAILQRRYQQSTHDKQARDKAEIPAWIEGEKDKDKPKWIDTAYIPPSFVGYQPSGAIGKLLLCILNSEAPKDPLTDKAVGIRGTAASTSRHHIYPTKFMKHVSEWGEKDSNNVACNIMFVEPDTNSGWLNSSPSDQVKQVIEHSGESAARKNYERHGIESDAFEVLKLRDQSKSEYERFLHLRDAFFRGILEELGFERPSQSTEDDEEAQAEDDE